MSESAEYWLKQKYVKVLIESPESQGEGSRLGTVHVPDSPKSLNMQQPKGTSLCWLWEPHFPFITTNWGTWTITVTYFLRSARRCISLLLLSQKQMELHSNLTKEKSPTPAVSQAPNHILFNMRPTLRWASPLYNVKSHNSMSSAITLLKTLSRSQQSHTK